MGEIVNLDGKPASPPTREEAIAKMAETTYNALRQAIGETMPNATIEDIYCVLGCLQEQLYVSINSKK
jgi:hypothetical protein